MSDNFLKISFPCRNMAKASKEAKQKPVVSGLCALLNSGGGELRLYFGDDTSIAFADKIARMVEQQLITILGTCGVNKYIHLQTKTCSEMIYSVKVCPVLVTLAYHIYLPLETQVCSATALESSEDIKEILDKMRNVDFDKRVKLRTHQKDFTLNRICGNLSESKTTQFKLLKNEPSKNITLAQRIIDNKLTIYVAAFANHFGGHIYIGVSDDRIVKGQKVLDTEKKKIVEKVSKVINEMIWPLQCERGKQWDIYFETVMGAQGHPIPSTYVVVISVAPCPGGVFTQKPESYHVVQSNAEMMSFSEWRARFLGLDALSTSSEIATVPERCGYSSGRVEGTYIMVTKLLMRLRNESDEVGFSYCVANVRSLYQDDYVKLITKSQEAVKAYLHGHLLKADRLHEEYRKDLSKFTVDAHIFRLKDFIMKSGIERCRGNYKKSYELAECSLKEIQFIPPSLITAWALVHIAVVATILAFQEATEEMSLKLMKVAEKCHQDALQHANKSKDAFPGDVADHEVKALVNLAMLKLRYSISGNTNHKNCVAIKEIQEAERKLESVWSILKKNPASPYREVMFLLVRSMLHFRYSQHPQSGPGSKHNPPEDLEIAIRYSQKAKSLAMKCKFQELIVSSNTFLAVLVEAILRFKFSGISLR